jgi:xanthine dehydrogenase iron-sulfur cluster and FAD-binding subunit A
VLAGHLCRCTGYRNIVRAAVRALGDEAPGDDPGRDVTLLARAGGGERS